jgi:hypothetical protein
VQGIALPPLGRTGENDPLIAERNLRDILDRNQQASPEPPPPHEQRVGTIDPRLEMHLLDDALTPARRVDAEAFAAAEPVGEVKGRSPEDPDLAVHVALLSPRYLGLAQSRSRSAKLAADRPHCQERLLLAVAFEV